MSSPISLKITPEQAHEMPMVDLAFMVLKANNTPMYYRDLMQEIARIKVLSDDAILQVIAQVYTEINIDGRFACVGNNMWGLKRWYPVEKAEEAMGGAGRPRIINDDDDDLDDEDLFEEEQEEDYVDDDEVDYDAVDEDGEDVFEEAEAEDIAEEVDDEEIDEDAEAEDEESSDEDEEFDDLEDEDSSEEDDK